MLIFFKIIFFKLKILSGALSEGQTVWTQIRTNFMLVLIWVQTVCKGFKQMTKVTASKERVNMLILNANVLLERSSWFFFMH